MTLSGFGRDASWGVRLLECCALMAMCIVNSHPRWVNLQRRLFRPPDAYTDDEDRVDV